ncbi:MAG TPA: hypothetical protein VFG83_05080 [Kofleriaceae bacterium]|nr:hypothetical protein [Kofleriaceae bacterium]
MRKVLVGCGVISVALAARPCVGWACFIGYGPEPYEIDPAIDDDIPPAALTVTEVRIRRGHSGSSSCDDIGFIDIYVDPASGDTASPEEMGYQVVLTEGSLPEDLVLPVGPTTSLNFYWTDGATEDQEPISFTLAISAVDPAGNVGPAVSVVVSDPGGGGFFGCGASPGGGSPWAVVLWLAVIAATTRRQRVR